MSPDPYPVPPPLYTPTPTHWAIPAAPAFEQPEPTAGMTLAELLEAYAEAERSARWTRGNLKQLAAQADESDARLDRVTTLLLTALTDEHGLIDPRTLSVDAANGLRRDALERERRARARRRGDLIDRARADLTRDQRDRLDQART